MVSLTRTTAPEAALFETQQLQDQLRITVISDADKANLEAYLAAAIEFVEGVCGCSIMKQTWLLGLDSFPAFDGRRGRRDDFLPRPFLLPRGPVLSVDRFEYTDAAGNVQALTSSDYVLVSSLKPPAIYPPYGGYFPVARTVPDSVRITYTAGMGVDPDDGTTDDPEAVRESVKMAVKFLVGHWYNHREPFPVDVKPEKIPYALEVLLCSSRIYRFDWESYYSCS